MLKIGRWPAHLAQVAYLLGSGEWSHTYSVAAKLLPYVACEKMMLPVKSCPYCKIHIVFAIVRLKALFDDFV